MGERKIPTGAGAVMVMWAFLFDLINIAIATVSLGLLDWIMDVIETAIFTKWFSHYGASLWKNKAGLTLFTMVLDAVPYCDFVLPWTWRVLYGVLTEREEM